MPDFLFGAGAIQRMGRSVKRLGIKKIMLISDPVMQRMGRVDEVSDILRNAGITSHVFLDVEPDPPVEIIEKGGAFYHENSCNTAGYHPEIFK